MNINDAFPSKYLKASDLQGRTISVVMSRVEKEDIGKGEKKLILYFQGKQKGMVLNKTKANNISLILPLDVVITNDVSDKGSYQVVVIDKVPKDMKIVDIGPKTVESFTATLKKCKTVFWNGPMGVYEIPQFAKGSIAMAQLLAGLKASTVIGGGSTADMVYDMKLADKMTFVSTGGGASMSFLSGEVLPGVEALSNKK